MCIVQQCVMCTSFKIKISPCIIMVRHALWDQRESSLFPHASKCCVVCQLPHLCNFLWLVCMWILKWVKQSISDTVSAWSGTENSITLRLKNIGSLWAFLGESRWSMAMYSAAEHSNQETTIREVYCKSLLVADLDNGIVQPCTPNDTTCSRHSIHPLTAI